MMKKNISTINKHYYSKYTPLKEDSENQITFMQPQVKQRNSNLELYRIIVMLLIVAHHYVVNSGLMEEMAKEPLSSRSLFFYIFGMWGKTGINCFVMITGYFMCKSQITIHKFLKLLLQVEFYNILIFIIFTWSGYQSFNLKESLRAFLPVKSIADDFTSCFLVFYLFIPFLNILIRNLSKQQHLLLVLLCLFTYTLMGTASFHVTMNYVSWFCVLYFIASYIRIYGFFPQFSTAKWGGITFVLMLLSILSVLFMAYKISFGIIANIPYKYVSDSNKFLSVATGVALFMTFKNFKMKYNKWINTIAASTFGVLLIHANSDTMRQWLWRDTLQNAEQFYMSYACAHAMISVITIFAICIAIDYIRIHTLEKWMFIVIDKYLAKYKLK